MQLSKKNRSGITMALASATSTLLSGAVSAQVAEDVGWQIDSSVLYYGEQDDRVEDTSLMLRAQRGFESGRNIVAGLSVDSLTGATPNGAVPLDRPQTFTSPSARGQYTVEPGETPLDDSFRDTRVAGYVSWTEPFADDWSATAGLSFSTEYDYQHFGFNGSMSREFDNGNTTVSAGVAYASDELDPEGGVPIPLAPMLGVDDKSNKVQTTEDKTVTDLLVGLTQIINEYMIAQINYSYSKSDGYLNDPFKIVSVLEPTGDPAPGPDNLYLYLFENRPDKRAKHSLFFKLKSYVGGGALDTSYRFMTDDWGIDSHTLDARYRFNLGSRHYLEPHLRWYDQSAADFYRVNLSAAEPAISEASADYRLADFTGLTIGLKYGFRIGQNQEVSTRVEWYNQNGDSPLEGVPSTENVHPDLDALIFQLSYRIHL